jgi:alkaline phosphatase
MPDVEEAAFDKAAHGTSVHGSEENRRLYGAYNPLSVTLTRILNGKSGIGWSTFSHTAVPVPVFALGDGSQLFSGYYDNTKVAGKIAALLGFEVR